MDDTATMPVDFGLSDRETILFDKFASDVSCTSDALQQELEKHDLGSANPKALVILVKYLSAKVAPHGYIIERTSKIGRGAKAVYSMTKRF